MKDAKKYELIRNVTKEECSWLDRVIKKGEIVYPYVGATYGCCSPNGTACTLEKGEGPFFELPYTALKSLN